MQFIFTPPNHHSNHRHTHGNPRCHGMRGRRPTNNFTDPFTFGHRGHGGYPHQQAGHYRHQPFADMSDFNWFRWDNGRDYQHHQRRQQPHHQNGSFHNPFPNNGFFFDNIFDGVDMRHEDAIVEEELARADLEAAIANEELARAERIDAERRAEAARRARERMHERQNENNNMPRPANNENPANARAGAAQVDPLEQLFQTFDRGINDSMTILDSGVDVISNFANMFTSALGGDRETNANTKAANRGEGASNVHRTSRFVPNMHPGGSESTHGSNESQSGIGIHEFSRLRESALDQIHALSRRFDELKNSFTLPATLDFDLSSTRTSPSLAYTQTNVTIHAHNDALLHVLQDLDAINSNGDLHVRGARRELVRAVEAELEGVESAIRELWERQERRKGKEPARDGVIRIPITDGSSASGSSVPGAETESAEPRASEHVDQEMKSTVQETVLALANVDTNPVTTSSDVSVQAANATGASTTIDEDRAEDRTESDAPARLIPDTVHDETAAEEVSMNDDAVEDRRVENDSDAATMDDVLFDDASTIGSDSEAGEQVVAVVELSDSDAREVDLAQPSPQPSPQPQPQPVAELTESSPVTGTSHATDSLMNELNIIENIVNLHHTERAEDETMSDVEMDTNDNDTREKIGPSDGEHEEFLDVASEVATNSKAVEPKPSSVEQEEDAEFVLL